MEPNGETPDCIKDHPALAGVDIPAMTGRPERGGIIVTKSLVFAGEGSGLFAVPGRASGGPMFRAYDKMTGEIVSEFELPAHQTGIPMTYCPRRQAVHRSGRREQGPPRGVGGSHCRIGARRRAQVIQE